MKLLIKWRKAIFAVILLAASPLLLMAQDNTEASGYVIVKLSSPAAVHYRGGIKNLKATAAVNGGRFDPNSTAYAAYRKHLDKERAKFVSAMGRAAPQAVAVRSFHATANAVVVELNGLNPGQLKKISGAKDVYESQLYQPNMNESVKLVNAPAAWSDDDVGGRGNAGDGVRVGVIDSGNVNSLIPGQQPFFNCKDVEFGGFFFSGLTGLPAIGIKNENGVDPAPGVAYVSDHGTHVSGTVGGCITTISGGPWDGTELSGVAPGATLVDYNVFPGIGAGFVAFGGSAFSHDIAAAIESSVLNGDDVINMSLGGGVQGPHDFLAEAANAAVAAGVVVVTSNGNSGPGYYTVGSPGSAAYVIAVGATTNSRSLGLLVMAPGFDPINAFGGEFPNFDGSDQNLIDWTGSDNEACTSDVGDGSLSGEVVLIARGTCSFSQKMANAKAAGAFGVVVYSDDRAPGGMAKTAGFDDDIPAVMVAQADGQALEAELANVGNLFPTVITPPTPVPTTANELAGFSSRGPAPFTGIIKPDMVAPGVDILSSVFVGYELFQGTSMASPHVAGASAVVLQKHPTWNPKQVKSALTTTATDLGLQPWEQGSGLLDIDAALGANAFFWPTNASFGTFKGKAPANGSIDISIETSATCYVDDVTNPTYVSASINGGTLTVDFDGGRTAPTDLHGGNVFVDCDGQSHTIPWGAVVDR
jgi:minor extracellular serine protease Vpr